MLWYCTQTLPKLAERTGCSGGSLCSIKDTAPGAGWFSALDHLSEGGVVDRRQVGADAPNPESFSPEAGDNCTPWLDTICSGRPRR